MKQTSDKVQLGDSTTGTSTSTTYTTNSKPPTEYGWACPRCNRINAPWVRQCDCGGNNYWYPSWEKPYYDEWWKQITCDSDTFKVHQETTTWKAPSSTCGSDSATVAKSNPDITTYVTGHNSIVGGSDYWDEINKTYSNNPEVINNSYTSVNSPWNQLFTLTEQYTKLQNEIDNLKEIK